MRISMSLVRSLSLTVFLGLACARQDSPAVGRTEWSVNPKGIGPIEAGMTKQAAESALGGSLTAASDSTWKNCGYVRGGSLPAGVAMMVENGSIARIDIDSGTVATVEGARIGDTEDRIKSLYGSRLTVTPQKYDTVGHYLNVRSSASEDTLHRIVFETDGKKVVRYRAGRVPQVEYVERCG